MHCYTTSCNVDIRHWRCKRRCRLTSKMKSYKLSFFLCVCFLFVCLFCFVLFCFVFVLFCFVFVFVFVFVFCFVLFFAYVLFSFLFLFVCLVGWVFFKPLVNILYLLCAIAHSHSSSNIFIKIISISNLIACEY